MLPRPPDQAVPPLTPTPPRATPAVRAAAGTLGQLRSATRHAHEAIDALLPRGLRHLDDYRRYLGALLPLCAWLERSWQPGWPGDLACWHDRARLRHLRHDAAALGVAQAAWPDTAPAATPAHWLGGCYVIEGSALGARLLSRHAAALAQREPRVEPARRFLGHITAEPARWRRFLGALDALPPDHAPQAAAGARDGFAIVHAQLSASGAAA